MTNVKPGDPIQPALNAGDVKLLAGQHAPGVLVVPSGRVIANEKGAILRGATLNVKGTSNVRLPDGLELDGANARTALILENASGIQIDGLFCHNYGEGLYVNGLADSWVRGSRFENVGGQASNTAIFGYNPKRCDFSNSLYRNCGEGIHFFWKLGDKKTNTANRDDVTITFNQFRGVRRHPIELQEGVRGLKVRGNWIGEWTSAIKSIIGISAALGGDPSSPGPDAWEIEIWENVIDGTNLPVVDTSQFMGIEVMGFDPWVHHNDINNMGQPIAVTFNSNATKIEANNVRGTVRPPQSWWKDDKGIIVADPPGERYVPVIDIGNHWSTDPMPGPPVDGGGGNTPTMQLAINSPTLQANGGASVNVLASALPAGTRKVVFHSRATGDTTKKDVPEVSPTPVDTTSTTDAAATSRAIADVHPGWHVDFMAEAFGANGASLGTSGWVTSPQLPGNPSTPWPPIVTPPPPGGDVHVVATSEFDIVGGVVKNQKPTTVKATAIAPVA
jgi:hypothetical protein